MISEGVLDGKGVEHLAARLGLGSRQLRRLFFAHLGVSPLKIAITHRVHFARNLIEETALPITQIALSSGFASIRQFNHSLRSICGQTPTEMRCAAVQEFSKALEGGLTIRLRYRPPLDWMALMQFLKARAISGVEVIECDSYQRTIRIGELVGWIAVRPDKAEPFLTVRIGLPGYEDLMKVVERIRRIFDLGADPLRISDDLSRDGLLKPLLDRRPGLRVPGSWDGFELAVAAVLGEQVTLAGSKVLMGRVARVFGRAIQTPVRGLTHIFPRPEDLVNADFTKAGITSRRSETLRLLARAVCSGELSFVGNVNLDKALSRIESIQCISQNTAHYIAMRALGEPDAFPVTDVIRRRVFHGGISVKKLRCIAEARRPWRAYATLHLATAAQAKNCNSEAAKNFIKRCV